jgi:hypothetical protein
VHPAYLRLRDSLNYARLDADFAPRRFHHARWQISAPRQQRSQGAAEGNQTPAAGDLGFWFYAMTPVAWLAVAVHDRDDEQIIRLD